ALGPFVAVDLLQRVLGVFAFGRVAGFAAAVRSNASETIPLRFGRLPRCLLILRQPSNRLIGISRPRNADFVRLQITVDAIGFLFLNGFNASILLGGPRHAVIAADKAIHRLFFRLFGPLAGSLVFAADHPAFAARTISPSSRLA